MADRLRAMFCDHLSLMRGKYLPASKLKSDGTRMAHAELTGVADDPEALGLRLAEDLRRQGATEILAALGS